MLIKPFTDQVQWLYSCSLFPRWFSLVRLRKVWYVRWSPLHFFQVHEFDCVPNKITLPGSALVLMGKAILFLLPTCESFCLGLVQWSFLHCRNFATKVNKLKRYYCREWVSFPGMFSCFKLIRFCWINNFQYTQSVCPVISKTFL